MLTATPIELGRLRRLSLRWWLEKKRKFAARIKRLERMQEISVNRWLNHERFDGEFLGWYCIAVLLSILFWNCQDSILYSLSLHDRLKRFGPHLDPDDDASTPGCDPPLPTRSIYYAGSRISPVRAVEYNNSVLKMRGWPKDTKDCCYQSTNSPLRRIPHIPQPLAHSILSNPCSCFFYPNVLFQMQVVVITYDTNFNCT